jgi:hypothetical protein
MANTNADAKDAPFYKDTEVVTDPKSDEAVQIPDGANDGTAPAVHPATEPSPNEVFGDPTDGGASRSEPSVPAPHDEPAQPRPEDVFSGDAEPTSVVPDPDAPAADESDPEDE